MKRDLRYPLKIRAVWFDEDSKKVCWINTLKLPFQEEVYCSDDPGRVAKAIVDMEIRGAPAIGVAAALAVGAYSTRISGLPLGDFKERVEEAIDTLWRTRPTAYNLFYALKRLRRVLEEGVAGGVEPPVLSRRILEEALEVMWEDVESNIMIGEHGAELIPDGATILTHCNAGALATSAFGTAEAVMRVAWYKGKRIRVIATETRPMLQGARLTVWELVKEGIPVTLITDNMAGYVIRKGLVNAVIVGADRVTREGYVVNKIGTYMIALAAKRHGVPFYVAAPTSTIDLSSTVNDVVIEERNPWEVKHVLGRPITLEEADALNYAFDITDPDLVTAIITEKGVVYPPFRESLERIMGGR
ncbi:translation initiation factor, aIF-2BI family [Desulfurococcus mucosus DSM 2162]|uniref:Putative methylthioribose-1-phosphate isomerase n=1 Tax=Desulfurococcus mucosus (strain ATCC 35584 / DSM 2162 / JCM 9187 / O7/1) TaxID=765177 RepID=E8RAQ9_DESM0|nr:translation initiation factor, aIF-2BI family [Desulfurococcus mucosus DSM 2162]